MLVIGNAAWAYPVPFVCVVTDHEPGKQPCPRVSWQKLTVRLAWGIPSSSVRAVNVRLTVAPRATETLCGTRAMSPSCISSSTSVAGAYWGLAYEAGASCTFMLVAPIAGAVTKAEAWPDWSVSIVQLPWPGQSPGTGVPM